MEDYGIYHRLEHYVSETVNQSFHKHGELDAFDFFCIIIWKSNRAKSKTAHRIAKLDNLQGKSLDERIRYLTHTLYNIREPKERLRYLMENLGFRLPMASAILTILYPDEFTIYDERVCKQLPKSKEHQRLANKSNYDAIWGGYTRYKEAVEEEAPTSMSLRDKDRYLWGRSFHNQLRRDIRYGFPKTEKEEYK